MGTGGCSFAPYADAHLTTLSYRPFDKRWTYYTGQSRGFICRPRLEVMRHMLAGPNVGLCVGRAGQVIGSKTWDVFFVSEAPPDFNLFRRGGNCLFPLYTYPTEEQERLGLERQPNLSKGFVDAVGSSLELNFKSHGSGDLKKSFGPEDILDYIYALLHSSEYRRRYADFLKSDFPRVPLTSDRPLFAALVALGNRLASLHLMELEGDQAPAFPKVAAPRRRQGGLPVCRGLQALPTGTSWAKPAQRLGSRGPFALPRPAPGPTPV